MLVLNAIKSATLLYCSIQWALILESLLLDVTCNLHKKSSNYAVNYFFAHFLAANLGRNIKHQNKILTYAKLFFSRRINMIKWFIWLYIMGIMTSYLICIKMAENLHKKIGALVYVNQGGLNNRFQQRKQNVHELPTGPLYSDN